jgi:hypothetical protein
LHLVVDLPESSGHERVHPVSELGTLGLTLVPDWRVFLYMCTAVAVLASIMIGVVAGQISRADALAAMTSVGGSGGASSGRSRRSWREPRRDVLARQRR